MQHGYSNPSNPSLSQKMSKHQAYDTARKEFYTHRHFEDIERRIAREEALHTGAYFQPGPNALAAPLEDAKFEAWKQWAAKRVNMLSNMRMAGYSGSEVEEGGDEGGSASVVEEMETGAEDPVEEVEAPQSSTDAVASAVGERARR